MTIGCGCTRYQKERPTIAATIRVTRIAGARATGRAAPGLGPTACGVGEGGASPDLDLASARCSISPLAFNIWRPSSALDFSLFSLVSKHAVDIVPSECVETSARMGTMASPTVIVATVGEAHFRSPLK